MRNLIFFGKAFQHIIAYAFIVFLFIWIDACSCNGRVAKTIIDTF